MDGGAASSGGVHQDAGSKARALGELGGLGGIEEFTENLIPKHST